MAHGHIDLNSSALKFRLSKKTQMICLGLIVAGILLTALQLVLPWHPSAAHEGAEHAGNPRLFKSILLALLIALPLTMGGLFFTAVNHVAGSRWNVTLRRLTESYFWFLPVVLVMMVLVFIGLPQTYEWVNLSDVIIEGKRGWLNTGFFIGRNIVWILVWFAIGFLLWKKSTTQDNDGDVRHTKAMANISAVFLVIFGLTYSAAAWDLSMSLEPHWFSTMWAVYIFAGTALTMYASYILWIRFLKSQGYYGDALNENHIHDVSKFMFGHTIFWAYIAISQYMLIWYAHIPEETIFFHKRIQGGWHVVSFILPILRFIIPFLMLLRRETKRNINYMSVVAVIMIIGQIYDMYWVVYPTLEHDASFVWFNWYELGPLMFVAGSFVLLIGKALERKLLIPAKDPRLEECLHWHQ